MNGKFRDILASLPEKQPRSSIEPYRDLIKELRKRGRTYQEIARILAEKCEFRTVASTIYRFQCNQSVASEKLTMRKVSRKARAMKMAGTEATEKIAHLNNPEEGPSEREIQQRIAALKLKPPPIQSTPRLFKYDPNEPLHLPTKPPLRRSGE